MMDEDTDLTNANENETKMRYSCSEIALLHIVLSVIAIFFLLYMQLTTFNTIYIYI